MKKLNLHACTAAVFLSVAVFSATPRSASGAWVKIWDIPDMKPVQSLDGRELTPRDLNGDGGLEAVTGGQLLFGGVGHVGGLLIFDLAHGVPEFQEPRPSGDGVLAVQPIDLDNDGIFELLVWWTSGLECLKWNGTLAAPNKQEAGR